MSVDVRFYEVALQKILRGDIAAADLSRRAVAVTSRAKQLATGEPKVQTGRYRSSIAWRLGTDIRGLYAQVGSNVPYAIYIEEGTRPHVIGPRYKKALAWAGMTPSRAVLATSTRRNARLFDAGGEEVFRHPVKRVNHPGTRPYRVLQRALEAAR